MESLVEIGSLFLQAAAVSMGPCSLVGRRGAGPRWLAGIGGVLSAARKVAARNLGRPAWCESLHASFPMPTNFLGVFFPCDTAY